MATFGLSRQVLEKTSAAFDKTFFEHVTMGDAGLQREIMGLFRVQIDEALGAIPNLRLRSEWAELLHRLRGVSLAVGALELASYLQALERAELPPASDEEKICASQIRNLAAAFFEDAKLYC
jgi:hypothetical protein